FLLIADYLSDNSNQVKTYVMRAGGSLDMGQLTLRRDSQNRIIEIVAEGITARFEYGPDNLVSEFQLVKRKN
ncbi:MAG: hypothetical protein KDA78_19380, partial [Planctomycetaceae bacterium]|nr:hypothetical protein [Planctomycetaceae bacterium]